MVKLLGSALLVGGLAFLATPAAAQKRAATSAPTGGYHQEIGVDFTGYYFKPSGGSGGIQMGAPVDVRLGILSRSKLMWEPRLAFLLNTAGGTTYSLAPGLNVLYQLKRGTGTRNLIRAPYFTGGVALNLFDLGGPGGSATQFSLGGGVGTRVPFETAAGRIEGFLGYTFKGGGYPSNFAIGTRIGLSFWH